MQALQYWSFGKVLLAAGAWVFLCLLVAAAWLAFQFRGLFFESAGSAGISVVSFGFNVLTLAIPVVPPIVLIAAWLMVRRR